MFVDLRIEFSGEWVELLNTSMSHMRTTSTPFLKNIFSCMLLLVQDPADRKELGTLVLKEITSESSELCRSYSQTSILHSWRHWWSERLQTQLFALLESAREGL